MATTTSFGGWVRQRRRGLDLTQARLAALASCTESLIRKIEADERRPSRELAGRLAEALTIAPDERPRFVQVARGERLVERLPDPTPPDGRRRAPARAGRALPVLLTPLIGRERELAVLVGLLRRSEPRLVTLTGAGGVGKTRLALEAAGAVQGEYPDGVWLVELAALADPALVVQTVAFALGVREQPGQPILDTLVAALRPKDLLLVLDNCEHVIDACAVLADILLRACPAVRSLATSREPLGLTGEVVWRVPSLATPDPRALPPPDELERCDAVALFAARARAVASGFAVTADNAAAVAEVCRRLDGIPLALELAAARLSLLTVEQLAARLGDRFRLLTAGSRTALPRHRTLRATLDWSHDLLTAPERVLFRRLAVFAGGWTLEAAEAVCAGEGIAPSPVLDLLAQLVGKSLVTADTSDGATRYRFLDTLQLYGREKLHESGDETIVRQRHGEWFLALVEHTEPALWGSEQAAGLACLEIEHDNVRRALDWSRTGATNPQAGVRLAGALWRFWWLRGHSTEGRGWLADLLARAPERTAARAKALDGAGWLAFVQEDLAAARPLLDESLAIGREAGDGRITAWALTHLGFVAYHQANYEDARACGDMSLALARELDDRWALAWSLHLLGRVAQLSRDHAAALSRYEESLAIRRENGDRQGIASSLFLLGRMALARGDPGTARALLEESVAIARELGARWELSHSTGLLALIAQIRGDLATARSLGEESLALARELGDRPGSVLVLAGLGRLALEQGDVTTARARLDEGLAAARAVGDRFGGCQLLAISSSLAAVMGQSERALHLAAAVTTQVEGFGLSLLRGGQAMLDRGVKQARAALGAEAAAAAWELGRAMTVDDAMAYALTSEPPSH